MEEQKFGNVNLVLLGNRIEKLYEYNRNLGKDIERIKKLDENTLNNSKYKHHVHELWGMKIDKLMRDNAELVVMNKERGRRRKSLIKERGFEVINREQTAIERLDFPYLVISVEGSKYSECFYCTSHGSGHSRTNTYPFTDEEKLLDCLESTLSEALETEKEFRPADVSKCPVKIYVASPEWNPIVDKFVEKYTVAKE
jgi:hypothetical protein